MWRRPQVQLQVVRLTCLLVLVCCSSEECAETSRLHTNINSDLLVAALFPQLWAAAAVRALAGGKGREIPTSRPQEGTSDDSLTTWGVKGKSAGGFVPSRLNALFVNCFGWNEMEWDASASEFHKQTRLSRSLRFKHGTSGSCFPWRGNFKHPAAARWEHGATGAEAWTGAAANPSITLTISLIRLSFINEHQ